jgi:cholesterol oxidase
MEETHFDAIVVGSGFGGSVVAYRLADAGLRVCLLERGRAYPPGSFPRSPHGMHENFWDPSEGLYGLYDFWSFHRIHALVASGLGGGSLIYANVLMRKDESCSLRKTSETVAWNTGLSPAPISTRTTTAWKGC